MAAVAPAGTGSVGFRAFHRARSSPRWPSWGRDSLPYSSFVTFWADSMPSISAFVAGLFFGLGLIVSGMANPAKVLGFLDVAGRWDPSLALVMVGAIALGAIGFA